MISVNDVSTIFVGFLEFCNVWFFVVCKASPCFLLMFASCFLCALELFLGLLFVVHVVLALQSIITHC